MHGHCLKSMHQKIGSCSHQVPKTHRLEIATITGTNFLLQPYFWYLQWYPCPSSWYNSSKKFDVGCQVAWSPCALISVPPLFACIFAILFEFSGIFNQLFRLNCLYFHRNTALSIESRCTAFITSLPWGHLMSAMSSAHMMAGTIVNTISGRHALLCFRLNSEMCWTNWHAAHHPPTVQNQARRITFATTDHFIISPMPLVKNITIYGLNRSPLVHSSF